MKNTDMKIAEKLMKEGGGVLRLKPTWVPRSFCRPGKRIKLHPDDYYILGVERGGIDERWFSSTTWAENGPDTPEDEGLSYVVSADGAESVLLRQAVETPRANLPAAICTGICITILSRANIITALRKISLLNI